MGSLRLHLPVCPHVTAGDAARWGWRIGAGVAAFAAGSALEQAQSPLRLTVLAVAGPLAVAAAMAWPRACLVAALFLLVAYVPDVLAAPSAAHAVTAVVLAGACLRWVRVRERFAPPGELLAFAALVLTYLVATIFAADRRAAAAQTIDLVSYGAIIALLLSLLDSPVWLRRAVAAIVAGVGLLAVAAIVQQVTRSYGATYGGFATVLPAGGALRSAGPLNPNPFGQVLATSAVLAFYLGRMQSGAAARAPAWAVAVACVVAVAYTQSRAALIALLLAALLIGILRGVRPRVLVVAACAAVALGALVLPPSLRTRLGDLYAAVASPAGASQDSSLRGRTSENLAGLRMWADHPLVGVGPKNFELRYPAYAEAIGTDQRPEARGAHNLYLETLAETGLLGATAFAAVLWLSLAGAWRARRRLAGEDALLAEGLFVGLCAFLICALTLHSQYARYEWIFLGLGMTAGRVAWKAGR